MSVALSSRGSTPTSGVCPFPIVISSTYKKTKKKLIYYGMSLPSSTVTGRIEDFVPPIYRETHYDGFQWRANVLRDCLDVYLTDEEHFAFYESLNKFVISKGNKKMNYKLFQDLSVYLPTTLLLEIE